MARLQHVRKVYTYADGSTGRSAKPEWVKLTFEMLGPKGDDDETAPVVDTFDFVRDDIPQEIHWCSSGHGLSQKGGDDIAGIAKKAKESGYDYDPVRGYADCIKERLGNVYDNILAGIWVAEGESSSGAGNVTILLQAVMQVFENANRELSEDQIAAFRENLKDEEYRNELKARPDIDLQVRKILEERAAERRAQAEAKLESTDVGSLDDLLEM